MTTSNLPQIRTRSKLSATPCLYWTPDNALERGVLISLNESTLMVIDARTRAIIPGGHIDALPVLLD